MLLVILDGLAVQVHAMRRGAGIVVTSLVFVSSRRS
jgi:hypothetical protein